MKSLIYRLLFFSLPFFFITSCKKESDQLSLPVLEIDSIPFENNDIKIEVEGNLSFLAKGTVVTDTYFSNKSTGIAVTNAGSIYQTKNGGVSWARVYADADSIYFYQLIFTDNNTGYAAGGEYYSARGAIFKTTDGGATWKKIFVQPDIKFTSVAKNSKGELFAIGVGKENQMFKSVNNGGNWTSVLNSMQTSYKIVFSQGLGFCTNASGGKILVSRDDGITWNFDSVFVALNSFDINFKEDIGYCIANNVIYKTNDNGVNWTGPTLFGGSGFNCIYTLTASGCIVFGSGDYSGGDFGLFYSAFWQTKDGGNNWTGVQFKNTLAINCASFYTTTNGYAVSGNKLLKITVK